MWGAALASGSRETPVQLLAYRNAAPMKVQDMGSGKDDIDEKWANAEAALAAAQAMPSGPEKIEALERAGRMRFAAAEKRIAALGAENTRSRRTE
jgi:hypothetical protein